MLSWRVRLGRSPALGRLQRRGPHNWLAWWYFRLIDDTAFPLPSEERVLSLCPRPSLLHLSVDTCSRWSFSLSTLPEFSTRPTRDALCSWIDQEIWSRLPIRSGDLRLDSLLVYITACGTNIHTTDSVVGEVQDLHHWGGYQFRSQSPPTHWSFLYPVRCPWKSIFWLCFTQSHVHRPLLCLHICVLWADFLPIFGTLESYQYQAISVFATILAMNSMACRIFRLLRELDADEGTLQVVQISTIRFVGTPLKSPVAGSY